MSERHILQQAAALHVAPQSIAIGNDLVHLPDFVHSLTPQFIRHSFTEPEIAYCEQFSDKTLRYASTWAAKEAVYKAIKQVDENIKIWWKGIEIHRDKPQGKPSVCVRKLTTPLEFNLTISHDGAYVWALAMCLHHKPDIS